MALAHGLGSITYFLFNYWPLNTSLNTELPWPSEKHLLMHRLKLLESLCISLCSLCPIHFICDIKNRDLSANKQLAKNGGYTWFIDFCIAGGSQPVDLSADIIN